MRTYEQLERLWSALPPAPRGRGTVALVVQRRGGGTHTETRDATLDPAAGMLGDRWASAEQPDPESQITLMNVRVAELLTAGEQPLHMPGDNLLVDLDLSTDALPTGSHLRVGTALLEVTEKPHLGCKKFAARFGPGALRWVNLAANGARRLRGVNCRVAEGGRVAVGDAVERA